MSKIGHFILMFVMLMYKDTLAQTFLTQMGSRAAATGYNSLTLKDEWALFNNPGGLASLKDKTIAFAHDIRPLFTSANRTAALFANPIRNAGVAGIGVYRFGDELYNEQMLSAAFSNQFGLTSIGLRVNYLQLNVEGFGRKGLVGIDLGGIATITPQLSVGASIQNINQMKVSKLDEEYMPVIMRTGVQIKPVEDFIIMVEVEKALDKQTLYRAGFEYQAIDKFFFRSGFNLYPSALFGGFGAELKRIKIDYAIYNNYYLGSSHQVSTSLTLHAKK
jgi:hypothetical protein